MHKALVEILAGKLSSKKAAEKFGLKHSTVGYYTKRYSSHGLYPPEKVKSRQRHSQLLSAKLEEDLVAYLKNCAIINHGLCTIETRQVAYSFALANGIAIPKNWENKERASEDWMLGFLKRHSSLSIRKPEQTSQARASGFNKPVVSLFYDKLEELMDKYKFPPHKIWNLDESGNQTVMQPPNIIAKKGTKQVIHG